MAKILTSPLIGDIRKKAGNTVFQKGRQGIIVRKKVSPTQPRTGAQRGVRANFSTNSKAWPASGLDANRTAWNSFAASLTLHDRFGTPFKPSGIQAYQRINRNLQTIGVAPITTPPASQAIGSPGAVTVTATHTGTPALTVDVTTGPATNEVPVVYAAPPQSAGRSNAGRKYTYLFKAAAATDGPYDILAPYEAKYGTMAVRQQVFVQVAYINNLTGANSGRVGGSASVT